MRYPRTIRIKNKVKWHPITAIFGFTFGLLLSILIIPFYLPFYMVSHKGKRRRR